MFLRHFEQLCSVVKCYNGGLFLKGKLHLNLRPAAATDEVTIDAVEDLLWRRHFFKTHLNPKMKNRTIFVFDKSFKI